MFSEEKRENTSNSIKNPRIHSSIWYLIFPLTVIAILLVSLRKPTIVTDRDRLRRITVQLSDTHPDLNRLKMPSLQGYLYKNGDEWCNL